MKLVLALPTLICANVFQPKHSASSHLSTKREPRSINWSNCVAGVLPDNPWINDFDTISNWEEYKETLENTPGSHVKKIDEEIDSLEWCIRGCKIRDHALDWIGLAHEENMEKYHKAKCAGMLGSIKRPIPCPQCCAKIPETFKNNLPKPVEETCGEVNKRGVVDEQKIEAEMKKLQELVIDEPLVGDISEEEEEMCTGCVQANDIDNPEAMADAQLAHQHHFGLSASEAPAPGAYQVSKILKHTSQVVAGVIVNVEYEISNGTLNGDQKCAASIWKKFDENEEDEIDVTCM